MAVALALLAQTRQGPRVVLWTTLIASTASIAAFFAWREQPLLSETIRQRVVAGLATDLDATVELRAFEWHFFPSPGADGQGLIVRHRGRTDVPPLLSIDSFHADVTPLGLLRRHIARLDIHALDIAIPPSHADVAPGPGPQADSAATDAFVVDDLEAHAGHVAILPEGSAPPLAWAIAHLRLTDASLDTAAAFDVALTGTRPPGDIAAQGWFGPWRRSAPGQTPVSGVFSIAQARLDLIKGIDGTLSSRGAFAGTIDSIEAHGTAEIPAFKVDLGGHTVPLHAQYDAHIDGPAGDAVLRSLKATWLHTTMAASGRISDLAASAGPAVALDATIDAGRIEDVLALTVPSDPAPMSGQLHAKAAIVLPQGTSDVVDRAQLKGQFRITDAHFADGEVRRQIDALSAQQLKVRDGAPPAARTSSQFAGTFGVSGATMTIPTVSFDAPGAAVSLHGRYGLRSGALDFHGTLLIASNLSDTQGGVKHVLLKLVDPWFKRKGGPTVVPIKISGTREHPSVGLDAMKALDTP